MKPLLFIKQHKTPILYTVISALIGITIGVYVGIAYCKSMINANAFGLWSQGVMAYQSSEYDQALFYYSQAVGLKNDEPVFLMSIAEAYEAKKDLALAIDFYQIALDKYKSEKRDGPIKRLEYKIELLKAQLQEKENKGKKQTS